MCKQKDQYSEEEINEIVEILSTKASNPDEFFSATLEIISNYNDLEEIGGKALVILNNDKGIDIICLFYKINSIDFKHDFWTLKNAFAKALPFLKVEPLALIKLLKHLQQESGHDLSANWILDDLFIYCEKNKEQAFQLAEIIKNNPSEYNTFITVVYRGIAIYDFYMAYNDLIDIVESNADNKLVKAAIFALSKLDYNNRKKELIKTIDIYDIQDRNDIEKQCTIINSLSNFFQYDEKYVGSIIVKLSAINDCRIGLTIIDVLFRHGKSINKNWFSETLLNCINITAEKLGENNYLDYVLDNCVKNKPELFINFINGWLQNQPLGNCIKLFPCVKSSLIGKSDQKLLQNLITQWLVSGERSFCEAAEYYVSEVSLHEKYNNICLSFDIDYVTKLSEEEVGFLIRKTLGYCSLHMEHLCSLIFSLSSITDKEKELESVLTGIFVEIIAHDNPGIVLEFFKNKEIHANKTQKRLIKKIRKQINVYYDKLRNLPKLKECLPPFKQTLIYYNAFNSLMEKSIKDERNKSVFMNLVTRVSIKYGAKFFSKLNADMEQISNQKFSPVGELKTMETTIPIHRKHILDPIGYNYMRYIWRTKQKVETK